MRAIEVCFAPTACFAIDRRNGRIARIRAPSGLKTARPPHRVQPISPAWVNAHVALHCTGTSCPSLQDPAKLLASGRADSDGSLGRMLVTVGGDGTTAARVFIVYPGDNTVWEVPIQVMAPCADATWLDDDILVTSDDCKGGTPIGVVYDSRGRSLFQVGQGRALDTHEATSIRYDKKLAIVAPRAYALVLFDSPSQQSVIDLVPIQAEATPTPRFDVAPVGDGDWVVASATGGVGVVDRRTTALAKTWIIPRCEASP
jgi:hypothetical protein